MVAAAPLTECGRLQEQAASAAVRSRALYPSDDLKATDIFARKGRTTPSRCGIHVTMAETMTDLEFASKLNVLAHQNQRYRRSASPQYEPVSHGKPPKITTLPRAHLHYAITTRESSAGRHPRRTCTWTHSAEHLRV
jgi:hypothetical protein